MSLWARRGVSRVSPRADYYDDYCEPGHPWIGGGADAIRDDIDELTPEEFAAYRAERVEQLARKVQPGFTAWRTPEGLEHDR